MRLGEIFFGKFWPLTAMLPAVITATAFHSMGERNCCILFGSGAAAFSIAICLKRAISVHRQTYRFVFVILVSVLAFAASAIVMAISINVDVVRIANWQFVFAILVGTTDLFIKDKMSKQAHSYEGLAMGLSVALIFAVYAVFQKSWMLYLIPLPVAAASVPALMRTRKKPQ